MKKLPMLQSPFLLLPGLPYLALVSFLIWWVFPISEQQSGSAGTPQSLRESLFLQVLATGSFHSSALLAPLPPLCGSFWLFGCRLWVQCSLETAVLTPPQEPWCHTSFSLPATAQPAAAGGLPHGQHLLQAVLLTVLPKRKVSALPWSEAHSVASPFSSSIWVEVFATGRVDGASAPGRVAALALRCVPTMLLWGSSRMPCKTIL